jgi:hypothetical protein
MPNVLVASVRTNVINIERNIIFFSIFINTIQVVKYNDTTGLKLLKTVA